MATQEQLVQAQNAYHDLMTGKLARVVVDSNGERVEFTAANSSKLLAYIQSLQAQLTGVRANRPMRPFF